MCRHIIMKQNKPKSVCIKLNFCINLPASVDPTIDAKTMVRIILEIITIDTMVGVSNECKLVFGLIKLWSKVGFSWYFFILKEHGSDCQVIKN